MKFSSDTFLPLFLAKFKEYHELRSRWGPPVISVTRVVKDVCREHHIPQNKNQLAIEKLVNDWWNNLPKDKEPWEKRIYGRKCHISQSASNTPISIGRGTMGMHCMDLVCFW